MPQETHTIEGPQVSDQPSPETNGHPRLRIIEPAEPQEIPDGTAHDMRDVLPADFGGRTTMLEVPAFGFKPDEWSVALLRGLQKIDFHGKTALEPGVGTGNNATYLASLPSERRPRELWVGDFDARMTPVAARNADRMLSPEQRNIIKPCEGSLSLIAWAHKLGIRPDIVYGCLPQVPLPDGMKLTDRDAMSHYYSKDEVAALAERTNDQHLEDIQDFGLGLQLMLLLEAKDLLARDGKVALNLGGRPGLDQLTKLFELAGFRSEILHAEIIRQHEGTDLEPLATRERTMRDVTGHEYEFFGDAQGTEKISATEAHRRRLDGGHVYHNIYVIQGTLS